MGSAELAANLFRATQADEKLKRENIQGKEEANQTEVIQKSIKQEESYDRSSKKGL